MNSCLFVSDMHGKMSRYEALFKIIRKEKPDFVFMGGDLLPHKSLQYLNGMAGESDFVQDFLVKKFKKLKETLDCGYPEIYLIPGNDDRKTDFEAVTRGEDDELWRNLHNHCVVIGKYRIYGYACVPPTPFLLKDWERADLSSETSSGLISTPDNQHTPPVVFDADDDSIQSDILNLISDDDLEFGVFLFHSPPFGSLLDQADLGKADSVHVGSKALRNFIDQKQPFLTMHGHIHESARLSGKWKQVFGRTLSFSAAHDGPELAVVRFELHDPATATRSLVKT